MTHYALKQLAGDKPSASVQAYLDRAKRRLKEGVAYNPEHKPESAHDNNRYRWVEHPASGLRFVGKAHEIRGSGDGNMPYFDRALVDHTGWYTDVWQGEAVCGEVYQLPARDGKPVYVPAVSDPNNDGALLDFHSTTGELMDAVRSADHMAERYAEEARVDDAKYQAEQRIETIGAEIKESRATVKALTAELKETKGIKAKGEVCKALRAHIAGIRADMRKLTEERDKIKENYWEASPNY